MARKSDNRKFPMVVASYDYLVNPDFTSDPGNEAYYKAQTLIWEVLTLHLNTGKMRVRSTWQGEIITVDMSIEPFYEKYGRLVTEE